MSPEDIRLYMMGEHPGMAEQPPELPETPASPLLMEMPAPKMLIVMVSEDHFASGNDVTSGV